MLVRPSRIVVTVIAAIRTFTARFVRCETGRPRRLAAADAVQPPHAVVVPDGSGRESSPTYSVSGRRAKRFLATTLVWVIRAWRVS
jgi:hypothetical protein